MHYAFLHSKNLPDALNISVKTLNIQSAASLTIKRIEPVTALFVLFYIGVSPQTVFSTEKLCQTFGIFPNSRNALLMLAVIQM